MRSSSLIRPIILSALPLFACGSSSAQQPIQSAAPPDFSLTQQRALAATCAACHGTEGRAPKSEAKDSNAVIIPPLAALPRGYTARQMKAFRDGSRPSTVMQAIAQGLTDAQIEAVAFYFSTLKR